MYLSKVLLDMKSPSVRQALINCCDMHRNIQKMFSSTREEANVLYRVCSNESGYYFYIMSSSPPLQTKDSLNNGFHLMAVKDVSVLEKVFLDGKTFKFNLITTPYKKISDRTVKNSRRIFLKTAEERAEWFYRKGRQYGFDILSLEEQNGNTVYGKKRNNIINFNATKFSGVLCINDSEKFIDAWKNGIGAEKAYGMGMLMLQ